MSLDQCRIARDRYIIRKLETKLVTEMKKYLVEVRDPMTMQSICLTPMDAQGRLLTEAPKDWESIKKGNFYIINGQH